MKKKNKIKETLISTDIPQEAVPEYTKKVIKIGINNKNYITHKFKKQEKNNK